MAKPRIFISSTFYDFKQIRTDIDILIRDLGYEAVRNETGDIPHGMEKKLDEYCYKEIDNVDILVAIIGGRFGSTSSKEEYSITQMEIQEAIKKNKPVFIFIEESVSHEYETYILNKDNGTIKYKYVDDIKIFKFIEHIKGIPRNNPIFTFKSSQDVGKILKNQWAGLFKNYLQENSMKSELNVVKNLEETTRTLNQLVQVFIQEKNGNDETIKDILIFNHPLFDELQKFFKIQYRLYFKNYRQATELFQGLGYSDHNDYMGDNDSYLVWEKNENGVHYSLKISKELFDVNKNLKIINRLEWVPTLINFDTVEYDITFDDDFPF